MIFTVVAHNSSYLPNRRTPLPGESITANTSSAVERNKSKNAKNNTIESGILFFACILGKGLIHSYGKFRIRCLYTRHLPSPGVHTDYQSRFRRYNCQIADCIFHKLSEVMSSFCSIRQKYISIRHAPQSYSCFSALCYLRVATTYSSFIWQPSSALNHAEQEMCGSRHLRHLPCAD